MSRVVGDTDSIVRYDVEECITVYVVLDDLGGGKRGMAI